MKVNWNIVGAIGSLIIGIAGVGVSIVTAKKQSDKAEDLAKIQGYYAGVGYYEAQQAEKEPVQQIEEKKKFIPS